MTQTIMEHVVKVVYISYRNTFMITPSQFSLCTTAFAAKACHEILLYTLDVVAELILWGIESGVNFWPPPSTTGSYRVKSGIDQWVFQTPWYFCPVRKMGLAFQVLCNTVSQGRCAPCLSFWRPESCVHQGCKSGGYMTSPVVDVYCFIDFPAPWIPILLPYCFL
jgi:hypothetical protein